MQSDESDDFDGIEFDNLPTYKPPFVRCTKNQRQMIERLGTVKHRLHYREIVARCNEIIKEGRACERCMIRDIGELSIGEADEVIKELGGS